MCNNAQRQKRKSPDTTGSVLTVAEIPSAVTAGEVSSNRTTFENHFFIHIGEQKQYSSSAKWSVCLSPRIHKNYQIKIRTCWRRGVWQTSEPTKLWCGSPSLKWCDWTLALKEDEYFECCSSLDHNLTNISFQSITSISPSTLSMRVSVFHTYCYRERYPHIACTHGGAEPLCVIHLSLWEAAAVKQHEQKAAQPPLHHPY